MSDATLRPISGMDRNKAILAFLARYGTIIGLLAMVLAFSFLSPRAFPTLNNFTNVLNQASLSMIIAGGLTVAVIVGELDLSIGFAASLHGILVVGLVVRFGLPVPLAILAVCLLGALIGLVNGFIVTKMKVNSVIATLGVGTILTGLAFAYSAGMPIVSGVPEAFLQVSLGRWLWGVPNNIVIMALVLGFLWLVVERSRVGQEIQAVGGNPTAAFLSGIDVDRVKTLGFVVSGVCAALTGVLLASRLGSGTPSAADGYLLTAFAAVFLGSATLRDGEFHVFGTFVGALIIAVCFNGLNIFGAPTFSQYILQGAILILAVGLSSLGRVIAER
ncbi:ABC transporter permease [Aureimonas leprariae]|uniref:ABC transporter permease n=1 Tax=Plantimonas leprariae TaxID=2615207 RepID=A0A7V7PMT8_9HYPH|nr:ABC transporter permease [Aureimonas leprariae]KAB0678514.1 ABC transporter permease [Aureimonas leprariae]